MDQIDTSGKALVEFWKRVGEKGDMNPNTAGAYKAACAAVLPALDDWQTVDVRTIVPEDLFRRFQNKFSGKFKQESLRAYSRRWPIAVSSFIQYAADPLAWKPPGSERANGSSSQKKSDPAPPAAAPAAPSTIAGTIADPPRAATHAIPGLVEYPFPLRDGRLAYLRLPPDLKSNEAKRLITFVNSLTVDGEVS